MKDRTRPRASWMEIAPETDEKRKTQKNSYTLVAGNGVSIEFEFHPLRYGRKC